MTWKILLALFELWLVAMVLYVYFKVFLFA